LNLRAARATKGGQGEQPMRRLALFGLLATVLVASAAPAFAQSATPASAPAAQAFRKLEYSRSGGWEIAAIGNDEKVNHCMLTRGTSSADPKPGAPKFAFASTKPGRSCSFARRTSNTPRRRASRDRDDGGRHREQAAGCDRRSDLAISASARRRSSTRCSHQHLDVRVEDITVRSRLRSQRDQGRARSMHGEYRQPGEGWSKGEFERILKQVKRGTASARPTSAPT